MQQTTLPKCIAKPVHRADPYDRFQAYMSSIEAAQADPRFRYKPAAFVTELMEMHHNWPGHRRGLFCLQLALFGGSSGAEKASIKRRPRSRVRSAVAQN